MLMHYLQNNLYLKPVSNKPISMKIRKIGDKMINPSNENKTSKNLSINYQLRIENKILVSEI
jgi:hypothetical protein